MRASELRLALSLVVGCGGAPLEVSTETSTSDSLPTSGSPTSMPDDTTAGPATSASTGEEVCPPAPPEDGGYDPCPGLCGGGGQCFYDEAEFAVCTRGCFMDCNCWPAPEGDGDATPSCNATLLEDTRLCVLDCSGGESCPRGMFCMPDFGICAHPYSGSETTESGGSGSGSSESGTTDMSTTMSDVGTTTGGTTDMGTTTGGTTDMGTTTGGTTDVGTTDIGSTTDMGSTTSGTTGMGTTSTGGT